MFNQRNLILLLTSLVVLALLAACGGAAPEPAAEEEAPAEEASQAKAPEPAPEPPKPEAVPTKTQIWLREKHDIPALKLEKRVLQSQILAAIAEQDYDKLKKLRNRKKELRRLLNRV